MMTKTRLLAALVLAGSLATPLALHANSGRQRNFPSPGTDVETVGQVVVKLHANRGYLFEIRESPLIMLDAPDVILDVFSYPQGALLGEGRYSYLADIGWVNAGVEMPPSSSDRQVLVIVRGTLGSAPQSGVPLSLTDLDSDLLANLGHFDIAAGQRIAPSGGLMFQSHVTTVEERGGTNDTVLMVLVDDVPIAFDDNSGPAQMSFLCTPLLPSSPW